MKRLQTPEQAAEILGCHEQTVRRHCNAPAKRRAPHTRAGDGTIRVDAGELLTWGKKRGITWRPGRPSSEDSKDIAAARLRKENALAERYELAAAREKGQLLDAAEVESEWASIGVVVRNAVQNIAPQAVPLALSHGMPHQAAPAFRAQMEQLAAGVLRHLSRDGKGQDVEHAGQ